MRYVPKSRSTKCGNGSHTPYKRLGFRHVWGPLATIPWIRFVVLL
jgi:hypothetical protein